MPLLIPAAPTSSPSLATLARLSITTAVSTPPVATSCQRRTTAVLACRCPCSSGSAGFGHLQLVQRREEDIYNRLGAAGYCQRAVTWTLPLKQEPLMKFISKPMMPRRRRLLLAR